VCHIIYVDLIWFSCGWFLRLFFAGARLLAEEGFYVLVYGGYGDVVAARNVGTVVVFGFFSQYFALIDGLFDANSAPLGVNGGCGARKGNFVDGIVPYAQRGGFREEYMGDGGAHGGAAKYGELRGGACFFHDDVLQPYVVGSGCEELPEEVAVSFGIHVVDVCFDDFGDWRLAVWRRSWRWHLGVAVLGGRFAFGEAYAQYVGDFCVALADSVSGFGDGEAVVF
jgi:hypothetical protein